VPKAVEELMRFVPLGIGAGIARYALEDVEVGGITVRAGEPVLPALASANRDESVYADPDVLDLRRAESSHVGFGHGPHHWTAASRGGTACPLAARSASRSPGDLLASRGVPHVVRAREVVPRGLGPRGRQPRSHLCRAQARRVDAAALGDRARRGVRCVEATYRHGPTPFVPKFVNPTVIRLPSVPHDHSLNFERSVEVHEADPVGEHHGLHPVAQVELGEDA
jgi:hypothetical protein